MRDRSFIAQSFRSDGRRLVACEPQRFDTAEQAIASARRAAERKPGSVAYSVLDDESLDPASGGSLARSVMLFRAGRIPSELDAPTPPRLEAIHNGQIGSGGSKTPPPRRYPEGLAYGRERESSNATR